MEDFNFKHLASGDLLRNQIASQTPAGKQAEEYLKKGDLVPDELMVALMTKELGALQQSWLLDGNFIVYWFFRFIRYKRGTLGIVYKLLV